MSTLDLLSIISFRSRKQARHQCQGTLVLLRRMPNFDPSRKQWLTDVMANLVVKVHPSQFQLTLFLDGYSFLIASTVSGYSLLQILLSMMRDSSTNLLRNGLYDHPSSSFVIMFHRISAETNLYMRERFLVSMWILAVWKSFAASLERLLCQFSWSWQDLNVKYKFPLQTDNCNSSSSLPLQ